jgi:hypothetical protein
MRAKSMQTRQQKERGIFGPTNVVNQELSDANRAFYGLR